MAAIWLLQPAALPRGAPDDPHSLEALHENVREHEEHCSSLCGEFYCGAVEWAEPMTTQTYPTGMVSVDYPTEFEDARAAIHVSESPLFSAEEMEQVIAWSEEEGSGQHEMSQEFFGRGALKYGREVSGEIEWKRPVERMPRVLAWFNEALRTKLWPQMRALFPELVSDGSQLRAHSNVILKYNQTYPATEVHTDPVRALPAPCGRPLLPPHFIGADRLSRPPRRLSSHSLSHSRRPKRARGAARTLNMWTESSTCHRAT